MDAAIYLGLVAVCGALLGILLVAWAIYVCCCRDEDEGNSCTCCTCVHKQPKKGPVQSGISICNKEVSLPTELTTQVVFPLLKDFSWNNAYSALHSGLIK